MFDISTILKIQKRLIKKAYKTLFVVDQLSKIEDNIKNRLLIPMFTGTPFTYISQSFAYPEYPAAGLHSLVRFD